MQRILKLKYQNAVTSVNLSQVDSPVIFVGGRRRNRKKRRPRNAGLSRQKLRPPVEKSTDTRLAEPESFKNAGLGEYPVSIPVVSCLDIKDPVFIGTTTISGDDDARDDDGVVHELTQLTTEPVITRQPRRLARTTSDDSGIYEDDAEPPATHEEPEKDEINGTESDGGIDSGPEFDEVDLTEESTHTTVTDVAPRDATVVTQPSPDATVVTQPSPTVGVMPPFMFGDFSEVHGEYLDTDFSDFNKETDTDAELPTVLGDTEPVTVDGGEGMPARLALDVIDGDDDVVLFDVKARKTLSVTKNPLYEYSLLEETRRYQSGYTTPFDNVNVIQMAPGDSSRTQWTDGASGSNTQGPKDEKACCTIL